ncbi:MAG: 23S rRNA (guanosine(2251)-2'-O)-methyltransferase RlmB [Actinomycetota bacterium]|nr:23S rRNA (guanosine(2251)-2'-O)-methyltransferase RlmB [Actinomycetota bacterium]
MSEGKADILVGRRPVVELLRAGRSAQKVLVSERTRRAPVIDEIRRLASEKGVHLQTVSQEEIERLAEGANHQGVVALTARYRYAQMRDLLAGPAPAVLFLDGVMDPHNLGSLLRSADGSGFSGIVIPAHRSVGVTQTVRRVSAGAAETVPVARVGNLASALDEARRAGLWVAGLDGDGEEDIWGSNLMEPPVGLVLGAEDRGISRLVKERCDAIVRIPSRGRLESLNVGVAGAVAMFEVARRRDRSATL